MSFLRYHNHIMELAEIQMSTLGSPSSEGSTESRETSPTMSTHQTSKPQNSRLLQLPNDIFRCVMDYLDRDVAWALKRSCRGMSASVVVDELLYRYPIQLDDVKEIRLSDWKDRPSTGHLRWTAFQNSINDKNRRYVQKLAMSHWCSIADFQWIEANLPSLVCLDITAIKDFVWTPEETWTWKALATACPQLFARLEELEVSNWADYTAHSRIEYSYSYNDYRYKQKFRISRRRDGGSVASMLFPACTKLKTLGIRERYSGFHTWNEWEVHQRVCCLVDGVSHCSPTMKKLRVHDYAPYRSLFSTDASAWPNITDIEIGLYSWMEDRRDREVIGPIPYRITQGTHHRDEEDVFDDKTYEGCTRDHLAVGNHVVQGVGASFEDLLQSLRTITNKYPHINIRPINNLRDITLPPFHLVNVNQRRGNLTQPAPQQLPDPVSNQEIQEALRWLAQKCDWKPILAWDSMMCDVFPANLEPSRTLLPKADVLSRIQSMVSTLRSLNIPIHISIGDRANNSPGSGLDGSLFFGDFKTFVGEGEDRRERLAPTQASFNLAGIAHMVDELTIQYPSSMRRGWRNAKPPTPAEEALLKREMVGWRRFWERYARQFTNLKKLTANVPNSIYDDWGQCDGLRELLSDDRWEMLEVEDKGGDYGIFSAYFFPIARNCFQRKRSRGKFVQRCFFRTDEGPLDLRRAAGEPGLLSEDERETREIPDEAILDREGGEHRFWPEKTEQEKETREKGGKRKAEAAVDDAAETAKPSSSKKRKVD